jgi:hypothetical protein
VNISDYDKKSEFNDFTQNDYNSVYLGVFINERVLKADERKYRNYATDSGTIMDKPNFCKKAINYMNSFDDLSPEAKEITKRLFQFIEENNK